MYLFQTLEHESVMPFVCLGVAVGYTEENQERLMVLIGNFDGVFQCVVVLFPLGCLHPVENEGSLPYLGVFENFYPLPLDHGNLLIFGLFPLCRVTIQISR